MVGAAAIGTREIILAGVFERLGVPSEEVDSDEEDEENENGSHHSNDDALSDSSVHDGQQEIITPSFSLHHGMYAPVVRLPPALGSSKGRYIYEDSLRTPLDSLLPLHMDEQALATELRQEEKLDAQDKIAAEQNENVLWGEYSRRGARGAMTTEVGNHGYKLRFRPPDADGPVKSQVFVVDSESE